MTATNKGSQNISIKTWWQNETNSSKTAVLILALYVLMLVLISYMML